MTGTPFPLGRKVDVHHDPRSLNFPATTATVVSKTWKHYGPVLDQGQVGSCTGNAMAQSLNSRPLNGAAGTYLTEVDALALYSLATQVDTYPGTYPPDDTGSDGLSVAKAAQQQGRITQYDHAFGLEHTLEALMSGPVLLGTVWLHDMFHPDSKGFVRATGAVAGGHEYVLLGVALASKYVTCLNSWSGAWGLNGRFRMTFDTLAALLDQQGDAVLPRR